MMFLSVIAHGETRYGDMLCDGMSWGYRGNYVSESYTIEGSKVVNGKTYGLLHINRVEYDGARGMEVSSSDPYQATIGIRDEGGRMYVSQEDYLGLFTLDYRWYAIADGNDLPYETTEDGELVLYDYTKNVGDVYCQMADGTTVTVTKTSVMKTEDGMKRRRLTLSNGLELLEGVGCTNSCGLMLFWLNTKPGYWDNGVFTRFEMKSADGTYTTILAQDFSTGGQSHCAIPSEKKL